MKITDRIILKTIDGKIVVRPEATELNCYIEFENVYLCLNKDGIQAWNSGEDVDWRHGLIINKSVIKDINSW